MKKLTMEHRCAYAPHGVSVIGPSGLPPYQDEITTPPPCSVLVTDKKMILRPLSDLTKPITHNGETFVPLDWIDENTPLKVTMCKDTKGKVSLFCENIQSSHYNAWPHSLVRTLLHLHFDVYNLIEAGLAIDINTLKK